MRLIDKDKLLRDISRCYCGRKAKDFKRFVEDAEVIDAEPRRYSAWAEEDFRYNSYRCLACGDEWGIFAGTPYDNNMNYCPKCGALMGVKK